MKQITGLSRLLIITFIIIVYHQSLVADDNAIHTKGVYTLDKNSLEGTVIYQFPSHSNGKLLFHLPPNWYSPSDYRTEFYISDQSGEKRAYERSEIEFVNNYVHENPHLAEKLDIHQITVNGDVVPFNLKNNPYSLPPKNSKNTLLEFRIDNNGKSIGTSSGLTVTIRFSTQFRKLPKGYRILLRDFIPRPVVLENDRYDLADHYRLNQNFKTEINVKDSKDSQEMIQIKQDSISSIPIIVLSNWDGIHGNYNISFDNYFNEKSDFLNSRILKVFNFLDRRAWIKPDGSKFNFVLWDGPLKTAGNYVLIPRKIFRYRKEYYKTFEQYLIKGIIESRIRKRFSINSNRNPWLIPALQAEVLRDYIDDVYRGDSRFFPWGGWLNPDFYQENTLKQWITANNSLVVLDARLPADFTRVTKDYHPWYEKGFHLLRTVLDPVKIETSFKPAFKAVLNQDEFSEQLMDEGAFYSIFSFTEEEKQLTKNWFSEKGSVDYGIDSVEENEINGRYLVTIKVKSYGSLSPVYSLRIKLKNDEIQDHVIKSGPGTYEFQSESPFEEVLVDPDNHLLENDLLDNSWTIPVKVRPIWDFPTPEKWILAISPSIYGNTFDENLFGLSFYIRYLDVVGIYIDAWKGENEEKILWETAINLENTPWKRGEIYFKSSELNASYSKTLGFEQELPEFHKKAYFDIFLVDEKLKELNNYDVSSDINVWNNIGLKLSFPFYFGNFSEYWMNLSYRIGLNQKDDSLEFNQYSINQSSFWYLWKTKLSLIFNSAHSYGTIPFQKRYPLGGPEGIPGFPRENELLFDQRRMITAGFAFPPILTHTNLNLFNLGWLNRVESELYCHWGYGKQNNEFDWEEFKDIELRFEFFVEWFNMYHGKGIVSIAQPIDHDKYKDYRIILFSNWVF